MNSSKFETAEEKKEKKEILKLSAMEIEGTFLKMSTKKKGVLLLLSFLFSFIVQFLYLNVDYDYIMKAKGGIVGTIGEVSNMEEGEGGYRSTSFTGIVNFDWDKEETGQIAQVFLKFWKPVGEELLLTFLYSTEGREFTATDSAEIGAKIEEEWIEVPLNQEEYTSFCLYLLNRPEVVLPIECIYLLQDSVTLLDEWESKVSVFSTILFTLMLYVIFLVIFTYPSFFKKYAGFILVGLIYYCFLSKKLVYYDDVNMFMEQSSVFSFWEYTRRRYFNWSSRQVIEAVLYFLVYDRILWAVLTTILCMLTCFCMSQLLPKRSVSLNWLVTGLFLMYPFNHMSEVGWIATTTNYLWPLVFIMVAMVGVRRCLEGKTLGKGETVLYCLAALYGGNQEQGAALLVGFFFVFFLYFKQKELSFKPLYPVSAVVILGFMHHIVCPGNSIRTEINTTIFEEFPELSLLTKLEMGYSSTFYPLIMDYNAIFTLLCILVFFVAAAKQNMKALGSIGITLGITILFSSLYSVLGEGFPWILEVKDGLTLTGTNPNLADPQSLISISLITITVVCLVLGVYLIFQDKMMGLLNVIILLAGIASRMIMGLSPSIWISGDRTFIFLYFCFFVSALFVYLELEKTENKQYIQLVQGIIAICAVVNMYYVLTDPYAYMIM